MIKCYAIKNSHGLWWSIGACWRNDDQHIRFYNKLSTANGQLKYAEKFSDSPVEVVSFMLMEV